MERTPFSRDMKKHAKINLLIYSGEDMAQRFQLDGYWKWTKLLEVSVMPLFWSSLCAVVQKEPQCDGLWLDGLLTVLHIINDTLLIINRSWTIKLCSFALLQAMFVVAKPCVSLYRIQQGSFRRWGYVELSYNPHALFVPTQQLKTYMMKGNTPVMKAPVCPR